MPYISVKLTSHSAGVLVKPVEYSLKKSKISALYVYSF